MERLLKTTIRDPSDPFPGAYTEYLFCREFRCLPRDMDEMPAAKVATWIYLLNAEAEAGKLRQMQNDFYGR